MATKESPEALLAECLENAKLDDGFIDTSTIDFDPLQKIVDLQLYDSAIDWPFFWHIFIMSALRVTDYENNSRALTVAEKKQIVSKVHKLATGVPYEYSFYYQLPDDYPGGFDSLGSIKLIEVDQTRADLLNKMNPAKGTGLAGALSKLQYDENIPKLAEKYIYIEDKGLVRTGEFAFLESNYSPDRLVGLYYSLHAVVGTIQTNSIRRHMPTPRVFDKNNVYVSNFKSPIRSSRAATMTFKNEKEDVDTVNKVFKSITSKQSTASEESARIQICNALYWYLEFLNNDDWSLQLVFLVSAVDSLFPTRKSSITKRNITPTVSEKAPVIAATISENESEKDKCIETIEKLFNSRNEVIHGKIEIHGYSKATAAEKAEYKDLVSSSEKLIKDYILSRIKRLSAS